MSKLGGIYLQNVNDRMLEEQLRSQIEIQLVEKLLMWYRSMEPVYVTECAFAYDLVIFAPRVNDLRYNLQIWKDVLGKYTMRINLLKLKVVVVSQNQKTIDILIEITRLQHAKEFKYLGVSKMGLV